MTILNEDNSLAYMMAGRQRDPFASRRAFAQKLAEQGADTSPVQSPWQGVGRLAQALAGAFGNYTADAAEKQGRDDLATKIADAGKLTDPAAKLAAYAAIDPSIGIKYSAQSAADELKTRTQRADDTMTAGFLLGTGSNPTQQAGGGVNPNNIGNVRPNGQSTGFQQPATLEDGIRLTVNNARAYPAAYNGGQPMTLTQIGQRWAPKGDGANDPDQWARNVASIGGLDPNQPIDLNNPQIAAQFARGVHGAEKGANVALPVQAYHSVLTGQGGTAPGAGGVNLAQGSADGSGNPLPPQRQGADPGAQYEAAAQRAQAAGRGDIALTYIQQATAVREAAAKSEAGVSLIPREEGGDLVFYHPRTGQPANRIVGGAKKAPGEGGAFAGPGMDAQARNALVRAAKDPVYAGSPEYAAAHSFLSQPRQSFDESRGVMVTLPPADLSAFPPPTFRGGQQVPPQGMPQQSAAAPPPGMPPAPSPQVVSGPTMQGAPPAAPQGGPIVTPVQGLPPKPMTEAQSKAYGFSQRMATANAQLDSLAIQGTSKSGRFGEALPGGIGNFIQTPEYQLFEQAKRNFMNAQLRDESGAVIGPSEFMSADKQYFPQPGQEMNKALHAQMAENRRQVVEAMMVKANILKPGERYNPPKAEAASPTSGNASPGAVDLKKKWNLE